MDAVARVAGGFPAVKRIYLFGSVTRPNAFRADSDVDVAVEGAGAADYFAIWRAIEEAAPGWTIDLRDIGDSLEFTRRVRATGKMIYERVDQTAEG
ncbi:MAG: nucleotidyltransferase domain-containing protein [Chloroflexi bacterium]|nr:nucleotidyltransferase domain-containing protein [Chloroflexota bacterium]